MTYSKTIKVHLISGFEQFSMSYQRPFFFSKSVKKLYWALWDQLVLLEIAHYQISKIIKKSTFRGCLVSSSAGVSWWVCTIFDSLTELRMTQLSMNELRRTLLKTSELPTTQLQTSELRTTQLRTTELSKGPNLSWLNLEQD